MFMWVLVSRVLCDAVQVFVLQCHLDNGVAVQLLDCVYDFFAALFVLNFRDTGHPERQEHGPAPAV